MEYEIMDKKKLEELINMYKYMLFSEQIKGSWNFYKIEKCKENLKNLYNQLEGKQDSESFSYYIK